MSQYAAADDLGLFTEADAHSYPPLAFVGQCHLCGAETAPIPHEDLTTGERLDPGARWDGIQWAVIALMQHRDQCPGPPPDQPGIHLRPANPNYAPAER